MPTVADYYQAALEEIRKVVAQTSDADVVAREAESWTDNLMAEHALESIEEDKSRPVEGEEFEAQNRHPGRFDINAGGPIGQSRAAVRMFLPVVTSTTLAEIWKHKLSPNSYSISHGCPIADYNATNATLSFVVHPTKEAIDHEVRRIRQEISNHNESISEGNAGFRSSILSLISTRKSRLAEKHSHLDQLAAAAGIKLRKKSDIAQVVPTAPKVRTKIQPIIRTAGGDTNVIALDAKTFEAILLLIDAQCRQFERTPTSFQVLSEEGLRDVMLSSLNAVFEGQATGESFRGLGKADIHLPLAGGDAFVAEVKFWNGPASLSETIEQLLGRLTWRDSLGVAIMLSENANFRAVLESAQRTLPTLPGFVAAQPVRQLEQNRFVASFQIRTSEGHNAEIHVLVYSLYVPSGEVKRVIRGTR